MDITAKINGVIQRGVKSVTVDENGHLMFTLTDGAVLDLGSVEGPKGNAGVGIASIARTSGTGAPGATDTYTITLTDGSTSTFTVYNGKDGAGKVESVNSKTGAVNLTADDVGAVPCQYSEGPDGATYELDGHIDMVGHKINRLGDPAAADDAATKAYVDRKVQEAGGGSGGEDGGYYAPSVDSGGNLTWTASRAGMPQVSGANIKGPKGDTGQQGPAGADGIPITWQGEWVSSNVYAKNDAVSYDGSAWVMTAGPVVGAVPGVDGEWALMARRGADGGKGVGIASIARTSGTGAPGATDTYTITMTDGSTSTFTVYNGKDGASGSGSSAVTSVNGKTGDVKLPVSGFGTCATAAAIAIKVVDGLPEDFLVEDGVQLCVKFSNANTAAAPQLSVAGASAPIFDARTSNNVDAAGIGARTHHFVYFSGIWVLLDGEVVKDGVGIQSVEQTTTSTEDGGTNVITVTKTDGTSSTFAVRNGSRGSVGPAGADGQHGADGKDGADGAPGADGKSAYQYAVEGGYTGTEAEFSAKLAEEMPDKLPNPNAMTFTGAVTGSYDGSAPLTVEIPSGGGASGGYVDTIIVDIEITEEVSTYHTSTLTSDQVKALKNADIIYFSAKLEKPSDQTSRGDLLASIYGSYYHATKFFYNGSGYTNVTPSSSAYGRDIAESISVKNEASGKYFQTIKWKNTDNQYGGEADSRNRMTITIPDGSVFNLSTNTVFGVGTTAKLIARRFL